MKKTFTLFVLSFVGCLFLSTAFAQTITEKVSKTESYSYLSGEEKPELPSSVNQNFYDANGNKVMDLNASSKNTYVYNEEGQMTESTAYYWNSELMQWEYSGKTTYEYDEEGNLVRTNSYNSSDEFSGFSLFENYINGKYQDRKNVSADSATIYYWQHFEYTFEEGVLVSQINGRVDTSENVITLGRVDYTYTDGLLTEEEFSPYLENDFFADTTGSSVTSYTYDGEGKLTATSSLSISNWGNYVSEVNYNYNDYSAEYAPTNFSAEIATGEGIPVNTVTLNWNAATSSDVTGYMVICDTLVTEVITGTTYTTPGIIINGEHHYAVVAVVNNEASTISSAVKLDVVDEGVVPAENLSIIDIQEKDEEAGVYPIIVAWTAPNTTANLLGYRVYYDDYYYEETTDTRDTIHVQSWLAEGYSDEGDIIGLDITITVVAVYETGLADTSNSVTCNPYDENALTAVSPVIDETNSINVYPNPATDFIHFSKNVSVNVYNLSGQKVYATSNLVHEINVSNLDRGIYVVQATDDSGTMAISKIVLN